MSDLPPAPPPPPPGFEQYSAAEAPRTHGKATAALVCGIIGCLCGFGIILGPVAIYLATTAKREIRESGGRLTGDGLATAGLVLGIIAVALFVAGLIIFAVN